MSGKQQLAEAVAALPDSITVEEAVERLYRAFKLKRALSRLNRADAQPDSTRPSLGARLQQLVDEERIAEAREVVKQSTDPRWIAALAPAQVRIANQASGAGLRDLVIAKEMLAPFVGQWVALRADQVLGAAPRRGDLRRRLVESGQLEGSVFIHVEE